MKIVESGGDDPYAAEAIAIIKRSLKYSAPLTKKEKEIILEILEFSYGNEYFAID